MHVLYYQALFRITIVGGTTEMGILVTGIKFRSIYLSLLITYPYNNLEMVLYLKRRLISVIIFFPFYPHTV